MMRFFLFKLSLFASILILFGFSALTINYILLNRNSFYELPESTEYIVFGHSHPETAFNDNIIYNMVNLAKSGESYFYTYLKVRKIIPNNSYIKAVFIEFENNQIAGLMDNWTWDDINIHRQFPLYFPLLNSTDFRFLWEKNCGAIVSCPPKSFFDEIANTVSSTLFSEKGIRSNIRFGGYHYLVRDKIDSLLSAPNLEQPLINEISHTNLKYLNKIIDVCKENDIEVYLIRSPIHAKAPSHNELIFNEILISKYSQLEFLDFKDFPLKKNEYGDLYHLNYKGAKIFSNWFNCILQKEFLSNTNKQKYVFEEIRKMKNQESAMKKNELQ